ncbi:MAG: S-methyl-5-thioribose-1-phosphate isomerase [Fidelibacterota bacterium]|nr:MAG: S-methyl-5-thioribose-1-phosphate isomerase [Candidatus Neomarinimicrobiota bacterium]
MIINGQPYRTVWMDDEAIKTIDQTLLPGRFEIVSLHDHHEVARSIESMIIRGAPAIGAMGAYGLAQAVSQLDRGDLDEIESLKQFFHATRPTAYDLTHALNTVFDKIAREADLPAMQQAAIKAAEAYADQSVEACRKIGELGNQLIRDGAVILTHCNAGALATVDYGTALAVVRVAHYEGKNITVYVDETRPRLQGAKLTAWELSQESIKHLIIADNAAGYYMQKGEIDIVITGADRIAANGDAANKIGTYEKAVLARANDVPFYIAAPISTIDFRCDSGEHIPIEERDESEVLIIDGKRIAPMDSRARNPAFDITPAEYIEGIITEKGIFKPAEIKLLASGNV